MGDCIKTKTLLVDIQENGIIRESKSGKILCRVKESLDTKVIMETNFELLPTCSKNERAFLDEIREKYKLKTETVDGVKYVYLSNAPSLIYQSDFTRSNLSELVEGKG